MVNRDDIILEVDNEIVSGKKILALTHHDILIDILNSYIDADNFDTYYNAANAGVTFFWQTEAEMGLQTGMAIGDRGLVIETNEVFEYVAGTPDVWSSIGDLNVTPSESLGAVKVSSNDTAEYLEAKLKAGTDISIVKNGTPEELTINYIGSGGGLVDSVFGRDGIVVATLNDYTAALIANVPDGNIGATNVQAALKELDDEKAIDSLVVHISGSEHIYGPKLMDSVGTSKQTFNPPSLIQNINLKMGEVIYFDLISVTSDITLTFSNPILNGNYKLYVKQGVISRDIIFPTSTETVNGGGNIVLGVASATQIISFVYNGTSFDILGHGAKS